MERDRQIHVKDARSAGPQEVSSLERAGLTAARSRTPSLRVIDEIRPWVRGLHNSTLRKLSDCVRAEMDYRERVRNAVGKTAPIARR